MPGPIEHLSVSVGLTVLILRHVKTSSDWIIVIIIAIISFFSHWVLDMIPHGHSWIPSKKSFGNLKFFNLEVTGFLLLVSLLFLWRAERWYFLLAIFFGCLQDALQLKIKCFENFSLHYHWFEKWDEKKEKKTPTMWDWRNALILAITLNFLGWTLKLA